MKFTRIIFPIILFLTFVGCNSQSAEIEKTKIVHPEWSYNASIYEVNIRQYTEEGTFKAFEEHLPRLKELGIDILWLMPIHPIGEKNRKGPLGSYYSVKDYKDVNPDYGTKEDFQSLVNKTHELGMKLIIDWVANHTAWDNPWVESHPEYYEKDSDGNFTPPHRTDWSDVIQLDYNNKDLWNAMNDALEYWVKDFDIDGYRCDVAAMVPTEYWNQVRKKLDMIKPVFMLAEASEPELQVEAFDMTYNWRLKDAMNSIAAGKNDASAIIKVFENEAENYAPNDFRMVFTTNHDENSWAGTVFERLGEGAETFAVLACTVPGMPLVYSGQEAGLNKRLEFFEKDPIEWKNHPFYNLYKTFLHLKKTNKSLFNGVKGGEIKFLQNGTEGKALSFYREKDGDKIISILNLSDQNVSVNISDKSIPGEYKIAGNDNKTKTVDENFNIELKPWGWMVLTNK